MRTHNSRSFQSLDYEKKLPKQYTKKNKIKTTVSNLPMFNHQDSKINPFFLEIKIDSHAPFAGLSHIVTSRTNNQMPTKTKKYKRWNVSLSRLRVEYYRMTTCFVWYRVYQSCTIFVTLRERAFIDLFTRVTLLKAYFVWYYLLRSSIETVEDAAKVFYSIAINIYLKNTVVYSCTFEL